jgi:Ca2+-binding RTX toxin-like protein
MTNQSKLSPKSSTSKRIRFLMLGSLLLLSNVFQYQPARAQTPVCHTEFPQLPVIFGTEGNDASINGTANSERICALGGHDRLYGAAGDDVMNGNKGQDTVYGEGGNDILRGGQDNDRVAGGIGNDVIYGDLGDDIVAGEDGADNVNGNDGNDQLRGGNHDDSLYGGAGNDGLDGGRGNDHLYGGSGVDIFYYLSGDGRDTIYDFQVGVDRYAFTFPGGTLISWRSEGNDCVVYFFVSGSVRFVGAASRCGSF